MTSRITPDRITDLPPNHIFVFGSNRSGRHGKGAAKTAMKWGAEYGKGEGLQGRTYALPTVAHGISRSLSVDEIRHHVNEFITFARIRSDLTFLVTEIGCGLAGHSTKEIAPLFEAAVELPNIHLPARFWRRLV